MTNLTTADLNSSNLNKCYAEKPKQQKIKRIGIIGYGHLGQFLKIELSKYPSLFSVQRIWNRSEEIQENVLALVDLNAKSLQDLDLVIEVAHSDIIKSHVKLLLKHVDLFIASSTSLADPLIFSTIKEALRQNPNRSVFVPSGADFWGATDIQRMADAGILKSLTITMIKHPNSLKVHGILQELCQRAKKAHNPVVLFDGPARLLCPLVPNSANTIAGAAIAAHNLGFDSTRVKLIADPAVPNWSVVEYEVVGENGFRSIVRRETPTQMGCEIGENTYSSILFSIQDSLYKPSGLNIC